MSAKRIVITGGPGTGKTSIINELIGRNYKCLEEISRQVTLEAQQNGIPQLFLSDPLEFSNRLMNGRIQQFKQAAESEYLTFMDRGIPDILAYMDYANQDYPEHYVAACKDHVYDHVFILAPWQEIYESDNERYESFGQALEIHDHLLATYNRFNYQLNDVPFGSVKARTDFILDISKALL